MADLLTPLPEAMLSALSANAGVQALLGSPARVYDHRPAMATFPYVVLSLGDGRDIGTKTIAVVSQAITFQAFSRQRAGREVRQILAALRAALQDSALVLGAGQVARCQEELASVRYDEKSEASTGLARYRVVVSD